MTVGAGDGIGGVATSGARGRSFSLGIADSVTVLGRDAASADAAATLVANAVDIECAAVRRAPAISLDPDSDLGERLVTIEVGALTSAERQLALQQGCARAGEFIERRSIIAAALTLAGETRVVGDGFQPALIDAARSTSLELMVHR
jgi:hypothetical protein